MPPQGDSPLGVELNPMIRSNPTQVNLSCRADYKLYELSLATLLDSIDFSTAYSRIINKYRYHKADAGRKPHPPIAMLKALILKELMQIPSRRKLANFLKVNEYWFRKCGFKTPPHHDCFSEFIQRLGKDLFEWLFNYLVKKLKILKAIKGEDVAIDATLIKAYAKPREGEESSDSDAKWGYSATKEWVFGYKVHLACDADAELPLTFEVTPANVYDSVKYPNLIRDMVRKKIEFRHVLADAGYDSKENRFVTQIYKAVPIIAVNPRRRGAVKASPLPSRYKKRTSVERVFSRLKEELCLKMVKVRELWRVTVHVAISLISMLCVALVAVKTGNWNLLTSIGYFKF